METIILDNGSTGKNQVWEHIIRMVSWSVRDSGTLANLLRAICTHNFMMVNGRIILGMGKDCTNIMMEAVTVGNGLTVKKMEVVGTNTQMEIYMKDILELE